MRIAPLLLILIPTITIAASPAQTPRTIPQVAPAKGMIPPRCLEDEVHRATARPDARPHPLAEEPAANHYLAVDRHVGGCRAPLVVRTGIGKR